MGRACSTNGAKRNAYRESQKERNHWEDQDVGGWIILRWIFERGEGMAWIGLIWPKTGTNGGFF
jgi:hypothetical protein